MTGDQFENDRDDRDDAETCEECGGTDTTWYLCRPGVKKEKCDTCDNVVNKKGRRVGNTGNRRVSIGGRNDSYKGPY